MEVSFLNLKLQRGVIIEEVISRFHGAILNIASTSGPFVQKFYK